VYVDVAVAVSVSVAATCGSRRTSAS